MGLKREMSGKHVDGYSRAKARENMVGPATYQRFRAVQSEQQFEMRPEMREQKEHGQAMKTDSGYQTAAAAYLKTVAGHCRGSCTGVTHPSQLR